MSISSYLLEKIELDHLETLEAWKINQKELAKLTLEHDVLDKKLKEIKEVIKALKAIKE